jgi:hypothetical protein
MRLHGDAVMSCRCLLRVRWKIFSRYPEDSGKFTAVRKGENLSKAPEFSMRTFPNFVRFQGLAASSIKIIVLRHVAPYCLVEACRRFRDACRLHQGQWAHVLLTDCTVDGDNKHLWNVDQFLPDRTAQYLRRQSFSLSISVSFSC